MLALDSGYSLPQLIPLMAPERAWAEASRAMVSSIASSPVLAAELADPDMDRADLFREAVKTFVRVQAAKRLAALGGQAPDMQDIPRRRDEPATR